MSNAQLSVLRQLSDDIDWPHVLAVSMLNKWLFSRPRGAPSYQLRRARRCDERDKRDGETGRDQRHSSSRAGNHRGGVGFVTYFRWARRFDRRVAARTFWSAQMKNLLLNLSRAMRPLFGFPWHCTCPRILCCHCLLLDRMVVGHRTRNSRMIESQDFHQILSLQTSSECLNPRFPVFSNIRVGRNVC